MRTSLTMIVKNEAANLGRCLGSVRGLFDEAIVVDTGSTDGTPDIAREHGAEVHRFAWCDDFAAARNAAMGHATGDMLMWLDADELVEPDELPKLRRVLDFARGARGPSAYAMRTLSIVVGDPATPDGLEWSVWRPRLWPAGCGIEWRGRLHEDPTASINAAAVPVGATDVRIRHAGFEDPGVYRLKAERNRRIAGGGPEPKYLAIA